MKLVFVGAGGFRTPGVCEGLYASPLAFDEVVLYDPDATRLRRIESVVDGLALERGRTLPLRWTTDRAEALAGADFVLCAIRPGGLAARVLDEQVPLEHGVIGQETTGAGGILFALRTLPALLDLAAEVAERAPQAWFLNFTNPAGLTTEALQQLLGPRVVGICDAPPTMYAGVAEALQVPEEELQFRYFGLNHLAWLGSVRHGERDLLPALLGDDERLARTEEGRLFGGEWLRLLGLLPNEYLVYYYRSREVLDALRESGYGRGAYLLDQQREFYSASHGDPSEALALWRATRDFRRRIRRPSSCSCRARSSPSTRRPSARLSTTSSGRCAGIPRSST
ncbi:MAG: 6-phospho-beta-glucosidase, partial [Gaiellaceae bacterium]